MDKRFIFKKSEEVRKSITKNQKRNIRKMYSELYSDVTKEINKLGKKGLKNQYLVLLKRDINNRIKTYNNDIAQGIVRNMRIVCEQVSQDKVSFLKSVGFKQNEIHEAFVYVPDLVVRNIMTGNIYQKCWTLSSTIWKDTKQVQDRITTIIAKGTAQGKSAYEIALDLEKYVNPNASKQSRVIQFQKYKRDKSGNIVRDKKGNPIVDVNAKKDKFYFGNVDYNAQRLARTMVSHAYQQSFMAVNENDPFVTGYVWHSVGQHGRTCDICLSRDGKVFKKDELPQDHPNGMCWFEPEIKMSMKQIGDAVEAWYNAPIGTYPDIDRYAADFME